MCVFFMVMVKIDEHVLDYLIQKAVSEDNDFEHELADAINEMLQEQIDEYNRVINDPKLRKRLMEQLISREELLTQFEDKTQQLLDEGYTDINDIIREVYKYGKQQGLSALNKNPDNLLWGTGDRYALQHLIDYDMGLIKNVSDELRGHVADSVLHGIMQGEGIPEIANRINDIPGLEPLPGTSLTAKQRAMLIARTETMRAHNTGAINQYKQYGVEYVEIIPGHDACDDCIDYAEEYNPLKLEEAEGVLPLHPNCYMPDTKIYTMDGWRYIKDVDIGDKVLSLNPITREGEFVPVNSKIAYSNSYGYMHHIFNRWFDTCVTPDHDCFIYQRRVVNGVRQLCPEFRKPEELNSESRFLRVIENNNVSPRTINVNGIDFDTEDFIFLIAWFISEGSILHDDEDSNRRGNPIKISQQIKDNRELLTPQIESISKKYNIKLGIGKRYYEFYSKELRDYFKQFGYSHEKYLPKELFTLSREDLNKFLDYYIAGDGHERVHGKYGSMERTVFTSSKRLVSDLSYIILLAGYYPSIHIHSKAGTVTKHRNGEYVQNYNVYSISINRSDYANYSNMEDELIPYDGPVYCVEVEPYHTLWTMRNGKTCWNGNCGCVYGPVLDEDLPDQPLEDFESVEPIPMELLDD